MKHYLLPFLLLCSFAFAVTFSGVLADTIPSVSDGYINDYANILTDEQEADLEVRLNNLSVTEGSEIAVVTINSLDGDTIENTAVKLFSAWGIGKKVEDNGLLLLVSVSDRKVRIEVGYGLEATITDAQASWIIRDIITPAFRDNNYYVGISEAVDKITQAITGLAVLPESGDANQLRDNNETLFLFIPYLLFFVSLFSKSKSIWLGGFVGMVVGGLVGFFHYGSILAAIIPAVTFGLIGLLIDYVVSSGRVRFGNGGSSGGGFGGGGSGGGNSGGFGGGSSGGGGASGRW